MVATALPRIELKKVDVPTFSFLNGMEPREMLNFIFALEKEIVHSNDAVFDDCLIEVLDREIAQSNSPLKHLLPLQSEIHGRCCGALNVIKIFSMFEGLPLKTDEGKKIWRRYICEFIRFCRCQNAIADEFLKL